MKTYTGGCHCGAVRFEVQTDLDKGVMACNCSICGRRGHWLSFVPTAQFKLLQGADAITDYQFGKKHLHHGFCKTCGIGAFSSGVGKDGGEMRAVNVRCLDDIDLSKLKVTEFDGKSR